MCGRTCGRGRRAVRSPAPRRPPRGPVAHVCAHMSLVPAAALKTHGPPRARVPLAVFSDVHANLPALRAVLEDVSDLGVEDVVCLGDVVGFGPQPLECVQLVRKRGIATLLGDHEAAVRGSPAPPSASSSGGREAVLESGRWAAGRLGKAELMWVGTLPRERRLVVGGKSFLLAHASPGDCWTAANLEDPAETVRSARAQALVVGHTHELRVESTRHGLFANPGSVGLSFDGPEATYLVLGEEEVSERRVAYDVGAFVEAMLKAERPLGSLPERARHHLPPPRR